MLKNYLHRRIGGIASLCLAALLAACNQTGNGSSQNAATEATEQQTADTGNQEQTADDQQKSQIISVKNTREFYEAIGDNRTIIIENDMFDLVEMLAQLEKEGKVSKAKLDNRNTPIKEQDGQLVNGSNYDYEPAIVNVKNLTIKGLKPMTHLQGSRRFLTVLGFYHCENITLENLLVGHADDDDCEGCVIVVEHCKDININNCKMYGCGYEGIASHDNDNLNVKQSEIYECTGNIMTLENTRNAIFENCYFHHNGGTITLGYNNTSTRNIVFNNCQIEDEFFDKSNYPDGVLTFNNCEIDTEHKDRPFKDEYYEEGDYYEEVWDDTKDENINYAAPRKIMHVKDAEQLIKAIGDNKTIIVDNDILDLAETIDRLAQNDQIKPATDNDGVIMQDQKGAFYMDEFDGKGLQIVNVNNLTIQGAKPDIHIRLTPRYVNVFGFFECNNISLSNIKMGHIEAGGCVGDVVNLNNCKDVSIDNCKLYGCGVNGLSGYNVARLNVTNSHIYGCSSIAITFNGVAKQFLFENCEMYDNLNFMSFESNCENVVFKKCKSVAEYGEPYEQDGIVISDCNFTYKKEYEGGW